VRNATSESIDQKNRRAQWMRQLRQWHWISGAMTLFATLCFAITGITLNHAPQIESKPKVSTRTVQLDEPTKAKLADAATSGRSPVSEDVARYVATHLNIDIANQAAEWSASEVYISMPRPGGDAWLSIDRESGDVRYEVTDRGWVAFLNDLHKGRHTGTVWSLFIDLFGGACVVFCVTGLLLLQMYAAGRALTWPMVAAGVAIPVLLAAFLLH
jgi:hypothetical protein